MYGLPIARIKENRDAEKRAKASLQTCKENGMGQPAKLIPAPVISEAGFTPEYRNEEGQWVEVPEDKLDQYYGIMDGHGRHAGYLRDLDAAALDDNYEPFKFIFWFQNITADVFKKQFPSLNFDTVKTRSSELAKYSSAMHKNNQIIEYTKLLDKKYIAKAAQYWNFGKEQSREDMKKVNGGETVPVDEELIKQLASIRDVFEKTLNGSYSAKVLHGVPLAKWVISKLKNSEVDRDETMKRIIEKFSNITGNQLTELQEAKGEVGNKQRTTEIVVHEILDKIFKS